MKTIHRARLETRNFTFEAFADTEAEAISLMESAWAEHKRRTKATMEWAEVEQDIGIMKIMVGAVYRDGELFPVVKP